MCMPSLCLLRAEEESEKTELLTSGQHSANIVIQMGHLAFENTQLCGLMWVVAS